MTSAEPWYVEAFRADYLDVYPHRDLESARREASYLITHGVRGRVLDLCCGFARHSLALRERGVDVVGIDLSADLLAHARRLPRGDLLDGRLVRADARRVPLADRSVDSLLLLFSSFGYFGASGDVRVLTEIERVLRAGGVAVFDLMNPAHVRRGLVAHSRSQRNGLLLEERRTLEEQGTRVVKHVRLTAADGRTRAWTEDVRMYEPEEFRAMLATDGFDIARVDGDFDGAGFTPKSARQIVHARKL